jgi:hypothetical protein
MACLYPGSLHQQSGRALRTLYFPFVSNSTSQCGATRSVKVRIARQSSAGSLRKENGRWRKEASPVAVRDASSARDLNRRSLAKRIRHNESVFML